MEASRAFCSRALNCHVALEGTGAAGRVSEGHGLVSTSRRAVLITESLAPARPDISAAVSLVGVALASLASTALRRPRPSLALRMCIERRPTVTRTHPCAFYLSATPTFHAAGEPQLACVEATTRECWTKLAISRGEHAASRGSIRYVNLCVGGCNRALPSSTRHWLACKSNAIAVDAVARPFDAFESPQSLPPNWRSCCIGFASPLASFSFRAAYSALASSHLRRTEDSFCISAISKADIAIASAPRTLAFARISKRSTSCRDGTGAGLRSLAHGQRFNNADDVTPVFPLCIQGDRICATNKDSLYTPPT